MDKDVVMHWALIAACQARIEAMKAENSQYPQSQPYTGEAFSDEACEISRLAESLRML